MAETQSTRIPDLKMSFVVRYAQDDTPAVRDVQGLSSGPSRTPQHGREEYRGERRVRQAIEAAAKQNADLLNLIASTADAAEGLYNSEVNVSRAEEELKKQKDDVDQRTVEAGVYRLRYIQRQTTFKKWFYIVTRMRTQFVAKIAEAEEAYKNSLAVQLEAERRQRSLEQDVEVVRDKHRAIAARAKMHGEAHKQLDHLYASIFDGPTPGFPDEDEAEHEYVTRKAQYDECAGSLKRITKSRKEAQAIALALEKATPELERAAEEADSAFYVSSYASVFVRRAARFLHQASELSSRMIDSVNSEGSAFTNPHTAMSEALKTARELADGVTRDATIARDDFAEIVQAIVDSSNAATEAQSTLLTLLKKSEGRLTRQATNSSREYEDARQALQGIRQSAFEITVGFGAAAPAYHECCDRAAGFTGETFAYCERIEMPQISEEGLPPPPSYNRAVEQT